MIKYMIRRLFRVAKYAAIGAAAAVVGTTVLGALGTGMAWFAAPSLGMGIGTGIIWGLVKVSVRADGASGARGRAAAARDAADLGERDKGTTADSSSRGDTGRTVCAPRGGTR